MSNLLHCEFQTAKDRLFDSDLTPYFAGRDGSLIAVVRPGQGAHVVEYATGGLAREEVAARIAKLEAAVANLQMARQVK